MLGGVGGWVSFDLTVRDVVWGKLANLVLFCIVCPGQGSSLLELFYQDATEGSGVPEGCDQVQLNAVFKSS